MTALGSFENVNLLATSLNFSSAGEHNDYDSGMENLVAALLRDLIEESFHQFADLACS